MIFVTVGTTHFDPLIKEVDRLKSTGIIEDDVIAQIGEGQYIPKHLQWFRYTDDMHRYYKESRLCICHGGVGSIYELLYLGKEFIAVANRDLKDDHQSDLLKALMKRNWCRCCLHLEELEVALRNPFVLEPYRLEQNLASHLWGKAIASMSQVSS